MELKILLRQGGSPNKVTAEEFVKKFLQTKKVRIRQEWEGKIDAGRKSITKERYELIEGKLRNYFVRFLGEKTDIRTVPLLKWNEWETWRIENNKMKDRGKPKSITMQNEMGVIRECWRWGIENSYLPNTPKLPFFPQSSRLYVTISPPAKSETKTKLIKNAISNQEYPNLVTL